MEGWCKGDPGVDSRLGHLFSSGGVVVVLQERTAQVQRNVNVVVAHHHRKWERGVVELSWESAAAAAAERG